MRVAMAVAVAAGVLALGGPALAEIIRFHANLSAPDAGKATASRGVGQAFVILDTDSKTMSWRIIYAGLSGRVTGVRFNVPPEPGAALDAAMGYRGPLTSPIAASTPLSDIEIGDLRAGLWSVSLLTAARPQGEIGGDLEQAP